MTLTTGENDKPKPRSETDALPALGSCGCTAYDRNGTSVSNCSNVSLVRRLTNMYYKLISFSCVCLINAKSVCRKAGIFKVDERQ